MKKIELFVGAARFLLKTTALDHLHTGRLGCSYEPCLLFRNILAGCGIVSKKFGYYLCRNREKHYLCLSKFKKLIRNGK